MENDTSLSEVESKMLKINKAILDKKSEAVLSYFDREYLLNYFTTKAILGYSGHECYEGNWYMFYNPNDSLFYPTISREPTMMNLKEEKDLKFNLSRYNHPFIDKSNLELTFYSVILSDRQFYLDLKKNISHTLNNNKKDLIENWNSSKSTFERLSKNDFIYRLLYPRKKLEEITNNISILEDLILTE